MGVAGRWLEGKTGAVVASGSGAAAGTGNAHDAAAGMGKGSEDAICVGGTEPSTRSSQQLARIPRGSLGATSPGSAGAAAQQHDAIACCIGMQKK